MVQNLKYNINSKKKIKLAIIGGGYDSTIAKVHLRSILATNKYQIICGCFSKNKKKNFKNAQFYNLNKNKIYNNLKELLKLESENIDLALVLTPPDKRDEIYYQLANKKIGIISEKPFEGNSAAAKKVYKYILKKKIFFISTYNYLGYPAIMEIKPLLKRIGKINNFILDMPQQSAVLKNNKLKKWRTIDKTIPNLHLDLASHLLSLVVYFFNQLPIMVNSFESKNKNYIQNAYTFLKFKKFVGQLWFSKNSTGKKNEISIKIFGLKGGIEWNHVSPDEIIFCDNNGNKEIISRLSKKTKYLKDNDLFTYSAGHPSGFLDAFINIYEQIYKLNKKDKGLKKILLNLKDNVDIVSVLDSIYRSSNKKTWQKVFY